MGMSVGGTSVVLVQFRHQSAYTEAFKSRLDMVLAVIDNGAIGEGLGLPSIDEIGYGCKGHIKALDAIDVQLRATRAAIAERDARDESASRDARGTLTGVAEQLVAEMESDNGCTFFVSEQQATRLNELCSREPMSSMTPGHLATLASGEHSDQVAVLDAHRHGGEPPYLVDEVYSLLTDIFEGSVTP